jgi:hypothetical protein
MTTSTPIVLPPKSLWAAHLHAAYGAGNAAVTALSVAPMVVTGRDGSYYVEGGVCGFARVEVRPRTSAWAKWLKSHGWYSSDYHKCIYMNISDYGQSMQRKEAFAVAVAGFLTSKGYPGVDWTSTID